jgi:hypothetical protein
MFTRRSDLFAAEKRFVYAVDHAAKPSARDETGSRSYAQLGRPHARIFRRRTHACGALRSRRLTRLLLEPRLGAAPEDPKQQEMTSELEVL